MGVAIQELDYRLGGKNQNADAPSHDPVAALFLSATVPDAGKPTVQLATVQVGEQSAKDGDDSLEDRQQKILNFFKSSCTWKAVSYNQMRKEHRR